MVISTLIFLLLGTELGYWPATAQPIIRLPVFFMGVCAGVLCNRIQQGDIDAFQSKPLISFHDLFLLSNAV